jgi:nitrogen regulatory protein PII 1
MKMVQALVRPEKEEAVSSALAAASFPALTKWDVVGRGKQRGIQVGDQVYDELAKSMIMVVVNDEDVDRVAAIISEAACSGFTGDGKIFVAPIDEAYTIRTGKPGL